MASILKFLYGVRTSHATKCLDIKNVVEAKPFHNISTQQNVNGMMASLTICSFA